MSADRLRDALGALSIEARVEARERLALLRAATPADATRVAVSRARVAALAAECGFTHVALEVDDRDAALPRD